MAESPVVQAEQPAAPTLDLRSTIEVSSRTRKSNSFEGKNFLYRSQDHQHQKLTKENQEKFKQKWLSLDSLPLHRKDGEEGSGLVFFLYCCVLELKYIPFLLTLV